MMGGPGTRWEFSHWGMLLNEIVERNNRHLPVATPPADRIQGVWVAVMELRGRTDDIADDGR